MRRISIVVAILLLGIAPLQAAEKYGGIKLLEGYSIKEGWAVDAANWKIEKKGGLVIHFESGPSEGSVVDLDHKEQYAWWREQTIHGRRVLVALVKPGLKTDPDLDAERGLPPGNILLVTFILVEHNPPYYTANFVAKVANQEELVDALLMIVTYDPSKDRP